jgi:hypothetical protein
MGLQLKLQKAQDNFFSWDPSLKARENEILILLLPLSLARLVFSFIASFNTIASEL